MLVKWNEQRVKVIPTNLYGSIVLLPGGNEVADAAWLEARKYIGQELKDGKIEEIKAVEVKGKEGEPSTVKGTALKDLTVKEAESLIKETANLATLNAWLETESRDSARALLFKQIAKIEKNEK
jgi:hypothetical protein